MRQMGHMAGEPRGVFIPPHGGYAGLLAYKKALIVFQGTCRFCERFLEKRDRTVDQMVQAAHSGKQNIVKGSKISGTSKEAEIKLHTSYETYVETRRPEVVANILICVIRQTNYLLDQLIRKLETDFLAEGGLRERMTRAHLAQRGKQKRSSHS